MSQDDRWIDPYDGFQYQQDTVSVDASYQSEKLRACGLDPALFADAVDPSFYIGLAIKAGVASGISAEGNVNMLQTLTQHRPAALGEPLTVRGQISAVTAVPRGRTIDTDVWFEDLSGERVISATRRSLKPDPSKNSRGAGDRPAPVLADLDSVTLLSHHRLTADQVKAYSEEGNSIHYDLAAAQKAGFRAPLIGGGMGVHYLLAALWARQRPRQLSLDIYFRRPVFWDDEFDVVMDEQAHAIGLTKSDGDVSKVLTEARILSLD